jgi:hypothetical protein
MLLPHYAWHSSLQSSPALQSDSNRIGAVYVQMYNCENDYNTTIVYSLAAGPIQNEQDSLQVAGFELQLNKPQYNRLNKPFGCI